MKVALVTGATRGIGRAIAEVLAKDFKVIGTATTAQGAENISAYLKDHGRGVQLNVTDAEQMKAVLQNIGEKEGAPLILVNNAGITRDTIALRMKDEQWDEVINTNLTAAFRLSKLCLKAMLRARFGRIVNISSVVAVTGNSGQANYVAAKAGLIGFTKSIAQEFAAYGITANCVAPGFIQTEMTQALTEQQQASIMAQIPMQRLGQAADIAAAVEFLTKESAYYITGQTLHVNGGMCMV